MFEPAPSLALDAPQRKRLEFLVRAGNTAQKLVQRARIILLAAAGRPNVAIAREVGVSRPTVLLCANASRAAVCRAFPLRSRGRGANPR